MVKPSLTPFRVLAVVHVVVALSLLPLTLGFGVRLAPLFALGPVWLVIVAYRLCRPTGQLAALLRRTHVVAAVVAALLCAYGVLALRAAERSAGAGGGLLGAFGLLPLTLGLFLGVTAAASLWLARLVSRADDDGA
ncbi:MAG TPA: hypothetical protein VIW28_08590 [Gemmatimonadales bacterium]